MGKSKVIKIDESSRVEKTAKKMDSMAMNNDLSFRLADAILMKMLKNSLISEEEYHLVRQKNIDSFKPILSEIME